MRECRTASTDSKMKKYVGEEQLAAPLILPGKVYCPTTHPPPPHPNPSTPRPALAGSLASRDGEGAPRRKLCTGNVLGGMFCKKRASTLESEIVTTSVEVFHQHGDGSSGYGVGVIPTGGLGMPNVSHLLIPERNEGKKVHLQAVFFLTSSPIRC